MKNLVKSPTLFVAAAFVILATTCPSIAAAKPLKVHNIFSSNMVIQRDKPITIWGWADAGDKVTVKIGEESAEATAAGDSGRWEVEFPSRDASKEPLTLNISTGEETLAFDDILIGDVWVMTGQSNMAFPLGKVLEQDIEAAQAHLPLLRMFAIDPNEQAGPQEDIPAEKIATEGWAVANPETALEFSAIGYIFGARLANALQVPIGVIKSARGGASIESIVPSHKFDDHPAAKRYADYIRQKMADFDRETASLEIWQRQLERAKRKGIPEDKWPKKPVNGDNLTSWNIPGMSPSDMGSVHHGMFGVFKGYNIKGVVFHQGFNNALFSASRPKFYRVLMKLMVEGWREDFNDPQLPVAVIGFCAGGKSQNEENFEAESYAAGPYIRESQRLGLADVGDAEHTAFIPGYDVQIPGLHPKKKREHGERAARWALSRVYGQKVQWENAKLVSAEPQDDVMILTFDKRAESDDRNSILRGFSIAGEDGRFYMAHARHQLTKDSKGRMKPDSTIIHVWSPLVSKPVAVRYAWATSPMGNLKVLGHPSMPLHSFRTDDWDLPANEEDFSTKAISDYKVLRDEAEERCEYRRMEEAKRGVEILTRLKTLGSGE